MDSKPLRIKINVRAAGMTQICIKKIILSNKYPELVNILKDGCENLFEDECSELRQYHFIMNSTLVRDLD